MTLDLPVDLPTHASALTLFPSTEDLLSCDEEGALWRIDVETGMTQALGLSLPGSCNALAATSAPLTCIDELW